MGKRIYGFIRQLNSNNNKNDIFILRTSIIANNHRTLLKNKFVEYDIRNNNGELVIGRSSPMQNIIIIILLEH